MVPVLRHVVMVSWPCRFHAQAWILRIYILYQSRNGYLSKSLHSLHALMIRSILIYYQQTTREITQVMMTYARGYQTYAGDISDRNTSMARYQNIFDGIVYLPESWYLISAYASSTSSIFLQSSHSSGLSPLGQRHPIYHPDLQFILILLDLVSSTSFSRITTHRRITCNYSYTSSHHTSPSFPPTKVQ